MGEEGSSSSQLGNTIRWSTASESDNFGYDIYRAKSEDGPFQRISDRPVMGAGTTDVPQDYAFVDSDIAEGKVYYYYVESIALDGRRERFTPVMKSKPKYRLPANEQE